MIGYDEPERKTVRVSALEDSGLGIRRFWNHHLGAEEEMRRSFLVLEILARYPGCSDQANTDHMHRGVVSWGEEDGAVDG